WSVAARADNPACAKFEEPLAYNACLAKLGPPAHGVRAIPEPEGDGKAESGGRSRSDAASSRSRRGRARMEFNVRQAKRRD
ncbi:MAG: hypothetical protein JO107_01450, partial [Hyphomicrobiales bacterium]|nr:hypothetical protein [Hyphomicrobiales bacterium]